jgi:hypothetical protein
LVRYWQQQAYAVILIIRTSDGEIRWMHVSAYLKRESAGGKKPKQIVFDGERFDVMCVRRWRESVLRKVQCFQRHAGLQVSCLISLMGQVFGCSVCRPDRVVRSRLFWKPICGEPTYNSFRILNGGVKLFL